MMTEKKRREPTILDRINNGLTSDRKVRQGLRRYAEGLLPQLLEEGYDLPVTKEDLTKFLGDWIYSRGFTGRGTKKLVDKMVSKMLRTYERDLRAALIVRMQELSKQGPYGQLQADGIRITLASGKIGKERDRWHRYR